MEKEPALDIQTLIEVYELDSRRNHGMEVFLYWYKNSNQLALTLNDETEGKSYHFDVPNDKGNHALQHPFWYQYLANAEALPLIKDGRAA